MLLATCCCWLKERSDVIASASFASSLASTSVRTGGTDDDVEEKEDVEGLSARWWPSIAGFGLSCWNVGKG